MDGIEIKICRIRSGLKQYQVAAFLGITQAELSLIETGRRLPSPDLEEKFRRIITDNKAKKW